MAVKRTIHEQCEHCGMVQVRRDGDCIWLNSCNCRGVPGPPNPPKRFRLDEVLFIPAQKPDETPLERWKRLLAISYSRKHKGPNDGGGCFACFGESGCPCCDADRALMVDSAAMIAEIERLTLALSQNQIKNRAMRAISFAVSTDFPSVLDWAQWCRSVVQAAMIGDEERVIDEIACIESKYRSVAPALS